MKKIILILVLALLSQCGGGGGSSFQQTEDSGSTSSSLNTASDYLEQGDLESALNEYESAYAADSSNTEAAFGAAFMRILLLSEHSSVQSVLTSLGQMTFSVSNVLGSNGLFAHLNSIHQTATNIDGYTSPFYGTVQQTYGLSGSVRNVFYLNDSQNEIQITMTIHYSYACSDGDSYQLEQDVAYDANTSISLSCSTSFTPFSIQVRKEKNDYSYRLSSTNPGTITIRTMNTTDGGTVEVELDGVTFSNGSDSIILTGTLEDTITNDPSPNLDSYLPFTGFPKKKLGYLLSEADADLMYSDLQDEYYNMIDEIIEIQELLEAADVSDDFIFNIPKDSFYGSHDLNLNRVDLKLMRASMHGLLMSIYATNSWECDLNIGGLFGADGTLQVPIDSVANDLNDCFVLKSDHELSEAKLQLEQLLGLVEEAIDSLSDVSQDGIFELDADTSGGWYEIEQIRQSLQDSLVSEQVLSYSTPAVTLNLSSFFNNPPSSDDLSSDLFVVESSKIVFVESAMKEFTQDYLDWAITANHQSNLTHVNRDFLVNVLDEFCPLFIGGNLLELRKGKKW